MNINEAIEKIESLKKYRTVVVPFSDSHVVKFRDVINIISQIDMQPKVVVPKFVAEWIEEHKELFSDASAIDMYDNLTSDNRSGYYHEVWLWVINHHYDFIRAWHDGYEVKKEQLYVVEIPNPNVSVEYHSRLAKNYKGEVVLEVQDWLNKTESYQLTESEIKKDFKWAWQWAEPVPMEDK
ncbi:DUF1642 domain-containing protein [Streptococcus suis]|nr:DUF1642 domain-containing protein [Streptococcus suis]